MKNEMKRNEMLVECEAIARYAVAQEQRKLDLNDLKESAGKRACRIINQFAGDDAGLCQFLRDSLVTLNKADAFGVLMDTGTETGKKHNQRIYNRRLNYKRPFFKAYNNLANGYKMSGNFEITEVTVKPAATSEEQLSALCNKLGMDSEGKALCIQALTDSAKRAEERAKQDAVVIRKAQAKAQKEQAKEQIKAVQSALSGMTAAQKAEFLTQLKNA